MSSVGEGLRSSVKIEVKVERDDSDVDIVGCHDDNTSEDQSSVKFHISMADDRRTVITPKTVACTDVTKPLSIQTKFAHLSMGPGTGSSTDTASEAGSALSSPA